MCMEWQRADTTADIARTELHAVHSTVWRWFVVSHGCRRSANECLVWDAKKQYVVTAELDIDIDGNEYISIRKPALVGELARR